MMRLLYTCVLIVCITFADQTTNFFYDCFCVKGNHITATFLVSTVNCQFNQSLIQSIVSSRYADSTFKVDTETQSIIYNDVSDATANTYTTPEGNTLIVLGAADGQYAIYKILLTASNQVDYHIIYSPDIILSQIKALQRIVDGNLPQGCKSIAIDYQQGTIYGENAAEERGC